MEKYSTNTSNTIKYSFDNPPAWFYELCREEEEKDDNYRSQHWEEDEYVCKICREEWICLCRSCDYCEFQTPSLREFKYHMEDDHDLDNYECNYCYYSSYSESKLRSHIEQDHSQEKIREDNKQDILEEEIDIDQEKIREDNKHDILEEESEKS